MTRTLYRIARTLALACTIFTASPTLAATPDVRCVAVVDSAQMAQLDCWGPQMQEQYERYIPVAQVNAALAPIIAQYTFSLSWQTA